jgi:hypothetical protein
MPPGTRRLTWRHACHLVREHGDVIMRLARWLMQHRAMDGDDIGALMCSQSLGGLPWHK